MLRRCLHLSTSPLRTTRIRPAMAALLSTTPSITLTPAEERLAQLLVECAAWIDDNPAEVDNLRLKDPNGAWIGKERGTEKVELRIAGGWVRDRVSHPRLSVVRALSGCGQTRSGATRATESTTELHGQRQGMENRFS